ncbi:hypothetical protein B0H14DRAFT_3545299 [Mycena olivaceomarginata]|nr:hypothetical protein B0H14DRAFT_3545299 [Mycena olivaceomarginata]
MVIRDPGSWSFHGDNTNARPYSPLPPSSPPIQSSPEHSPPHPATPELEPLPPLSSDGLVYTGPIAGTKEQRKAKAYEKGQRKAEGYTHESGIETGPRNQYLGFWVSPENSETAREETGDTAVNGEYVDSFSITKLHTYLQQHAKTAMKVFTAFSMSARNSRKDLPSRILKRATTNISIRIVTSAALALLGEYSHMNNFSRRIMGLYLYAAGAQRQTISGHGSPRDLGKLPKSHSETAFHRNPAQQACTLRQLSGSMRDLARAVAATGLYATSYDNINMVFRAAEQLVGKNDSQENGTCSTIWPLWKAALEDMSIDELNKAFSTAAPLSIKDGGEKFQRFRDALNESLPITPDKIELHQTPLHPTPAWNIDQSTIIGNDEVCRRDPYGAPSQRTLALELGGQFFAGDQLSIARLRSLLNIRAGHEGGYSGYGWGVWIPGLFHAKIADMHGFFTTHWGTPNRGTRNPGSLSFHNTHLHRTPILLSSLPPFRTCRDLVFLSLYARVLHCLLLETNKTTLDECADSIETFADLETVAAAIQQKYANADLVSELRWKRKMAGTASEQVPGDEIFENASLLLRDALISREFTDAIKAGDSGRIVLVLKVFACSYRGNGRTKNIVLNNWLVNPTENPFSWVEVDLMQEHMNFWIKTIYQAHGSSASWECVLRRLSTTITKVLGSDQGTKHQPADLKNDIALLMASLHEHDV